MKKKICMLLAGTMLAGSLVRVIWNAAVLQSAKRAA